MSQFNRVKRFNHDVLGIKQRPLSMQEEDEYLLSHHQLKEEIDEFVMACEQGDFIGAVDAIVDLMVFANGVAYKMGLDHETFSACFNAVMDANMQKKIGVKKGREGYDAADAVKPKDWVSPEDRIAEILREKIDNS